MPLHDFILPKPHTNSTVFDFLVIFCSFCVYSLVPGVWHPEPLGLIPHFYWMKVLSRWSRLKCVNALSGLYLISTTDAFNEICNLVVVSMPSRAYTSFLLTMKFKTTHKLKEHASMPSRAYTSFLHGLALHLCLR